MLRKVSSTINTNKMSVLGLTFVDIDGQSMAFFLRYMGETLLEKINFFGLTFQKSNIILHFLCFKHHFAFKT